MTDANKSWGVLCEGKPTFGHWSKAEKRLYINCLEMIAVCQAFQFFLSDLKGHHVLIHLDSMSVVSYINHQGGLSSKRLCLLAKRLLEWAQLHLCSLRAAHIPGKFNQGADELSRSNVPSEEWTFHPQMVQIIWDIFGEAEVDLFASGDGSHCLTYYSKVEDALAHVAQPPPLLVTPDHPDSAGYQANQGAGTQGPLGGLPVEESTSVVRAYSAAHSSHVTHSCETGPPFLLCFLYTVFCCTALPNNPVAFKCAI